MELDSLRNFATALLVFIILDGIWLGFVIKPTYSRLLSRFKLKKINMFSAIAAYSLLAIGISALVIPRVISASSAFAFGALFGLVMYGFYNFTNFAILDGYHIRYLAIDTIWGAIACGITSALVFLAI